MEALQWGHLHTRDLQTFLRLYQQQIAQRADIQLRVPTWVRDSLCRWTKLSNLSGGKPLPGSPEDMVTTDASLQGWGAIWNHRTVQGSWSTADSKLPINLLELRAIRLSLLHFGTALQGKHVLIRTDNMTAKAHVNKQGGTRSSRLHKETLLLFRWVESHREAIRAEYVLCQHNTVADWLSRQQIAPGELTLHPDIFTLLTDHFGIPIVDLFATYQNRQLPRFFVRYFHPKAESFDALTSRWPKGLLYAFPPIPLISKVLRLVRQHKAQVILVAPWWLRRPWFSTIQQLSQETPLHLPTWHNLLHQGPVTHPEPHCLQLTGWKLNHRIIES